MNPSGAKSPLVYMLAEAPGEKEDKRGEPLIGPAGQVLRFRIPSFWQDKVRFSNVVHCRPSKNREPTNVEMECCRSRIINDVEKTKPKAIFGFGNIPLEWAIGQTGITKWNGRRIPIKVGNHSCWYFPIYHPSYVLRSRKFIPKTITEYGCDEEFVFALDLKRAFAETSILSENSSEPVVHTPEMARQGVECLHGGNGDLQTLENFLERAESAPTNGIDYETNELRPYGKDAHISTAAVSNKHGTLAFALDHPRNKWTDIQREKAHGLFRRFLLEAKGHKIAHQTSFELEWAAIMYGVETVRAGIWDDSLSQAYLLDSRSHCLSLEFLSIQYFNLNIKEMSNIDRTRIDSYSLEELLPYNALDAKYCRMLFIEQDKRIKKDGLVDRYHHQMRRIPNLVLTQVKGIPIDHKTTDDFNKHYSTRLEEVGQRIADLSCIKKFTKIKGESFRPSSNVDVKFVVNKILGYKVDNVDETALTPIDHEFCRLQLAYRSIAKMLSTYVTPFMKNSPHVWEGVAHPIISTTRVKTWRTSSSDVNIQNQPNHGEDIDGLPLKRLRKQIKSRNSDVKVVAFDFGGIQARNVAMESQDAALVKAFWNHYDIHADWRDRLFKLYPKWPKEGVATVLKNPKLLKEYRQRAKNEFVFASFFGAQPPNLSRGLGIPENIATQLFEQFWHEFPDIHRWHEAQRTFYKRKGYITGLSGFRRYAPVSATEMINTPIQSDESVIVLSAMCRLSELGEFRYQANMEIHDDLTFLWPKKDIERNSEVVLREMLRIEFDWVNVPLVVERSIGDDWYDLRKAGEFESVGKDSYREINNANSKS